MTYAATASATDAGDWNMSIEQIWNSEKDTEVYQLIESFISAIIAGDKKLNQDDFRDIIHTLCNLSVHRPFREKILKTWTLHMPDKTHPFANPIQFLAHVISDNSNTLDPSVTPLKDLFDSCKDLYTHDKDLILTLVARLVAPNSLTLDHQITSAAPQIPSNLLIQLAVNLTDHIRRILLLSPQEQELLPGFSSKNLSCLLLAVSSICLASPAACGVLLHTDGSGQKRVEGNGAQNRAIISPLSNEGQGISLHRLLASACLRIVDENSPETVVRALRTLFAISVRHAPDLHARVFSLSNVRESFLVFLEDIGAFIAKRGLLLRTKTLGDTETRKETALENTETSHAEGDAETANPLEETAATAEMVDLESRIFDATSLIQHLLHDSRTLLLVDTLESGDMEEICRSLLELAAESVKLNAKSVCAATISVLSALLKRSRAARKSVLRLFGGDKTDAYERYLSPLLCSLCIEAEQVAACSSELLGLLAREPCVMQIFLHNREDVFNILNCLFLPLLDNDQETRRRVHDLNQNQQKYQKEVGDGADTNETRGDIIDETGDGDEAGDGRRFRYVMEGLTALVGGVTSVFAEFFAAHATKPQLSGCINGLAKQSNWTSVLALLDLVFVTALAVPSHQQVALGLLQLPSALEALARALQGGGVDSVRSGICTLFKGLAVSRGSYCDSLKLENVSWAETHARFAVDLEPLVDSILVLAGERRRAEQRKGAIAARRQVEEIQSANHARELDQIMQEMDVMRQELELTKREAETARKETETARRETETVKHQLETALDATGTARRDAEEARHDAETARREVETLRKESEMLRREMTETLHECREREEGLEVEATTLRVEKSSLEARLRTALHDLTLQSQETERMREMLEALAFEHDAQSRKMVLLCGAHLKFRRDSEAVHENSRALQCELEETRKDCEAVRSQLHQATRQLEQQQQREGSNQQQQQQETRRQALQHQEMETRRQNHHHQELGAAVETRRYEQYEHKETALEEARRRRMAETRQLREVSSQREISSQETRNQQRPASSAFSGGGNIKPKALLSRRRTASTTDDDWSTGEQQQMVKKADEILTEALDTFREKLMQQDAVDYCDHEDVLPAPTDEYVSLKLNSASNLRSRLATVASERSLSHVSRLRAIHDRIGRKTSGASSGRGEYSRPLRDLVESSRPQAATTDCDV